MDWFVRMCVCVLHGLQQIITPLYYACDQKDNAAVVGLLLHRGADLHAKGKVSAIRHLIHAPSTCASHLPGPVLHR